MNILDKVRNEILALAGKKVQDEQTGFFFLWQLKNNKATVKNEEGILRYAEEQKKLGFSEKDLRVEAYTSTNRAWYTWIAAKIYNPTNDTYFEPGEVLWKARRDFTKSALEEADAPVFALIQRNRDKFIDNKIACVEFIRAGNFYQNNLGKMNFDQETHDFVLCVKEQLAEEEKAAKEVAREELRTWAIENGSEFLKLRIKHQHNWQSMAETEWALAHSVGFASWEYGDSDDEWFVKNATFDQLTELEKAQNENPDCKVDIIRSKWVGDYGSVIHRTFLRCYVQTPLGTEHLFREIEDASDE
jgi:hypothetical protein